MGTRFFDDQQQHYIDQQRYVPMQIFAFWLRHGTLASEFADHLPAALANDLRAQEPGYRKEQSKANRTILWVFVISLLICTCTAAYAMWAHQQPPAKRVVLEQDENALDRFAGRAFALSLAIYAMFNLRAAFGFWQRKHPEYAIFWFLFAVIQILLLIGIFSG